MSYRSAVGEAVTTAVLEPIMGTFVSPEYASAAEAIVERRRYARSHVLCDVMQPSAGMRLYLRLCPTPWTTVRRGKMACRRPLLCPWCWARNFVIRLYDATVGMLWGEGKASPVELVRFRTKYRVRPAHEQFYGDSVDEALRLVAGWVSQDRRIEAQRFGASAGFVFHRVFITKKAVTLIRTGLLAGTRPAALPVISCASGQTAERFMCGSRLELARAVGGLCRVPTNLLTFTPEYAAVLLTRLRKTRMLSVFGCFKSTFEDACDLDPGDATCQKATTSPARSNTLRRTRSESAPYTPS